jgi:hypothetical protein
VPLPVVAGAWVVMVGGLPLAGSLQDVVIRARITSNTQAKINFFFMVVSLSSDQLSAKRDLHSDIILHHFAKCFAFYE